ncbi:hypothetical protein KCP91_16270 [Microvirga sp. SRT01]|uniref:Uncharacterized protein n=1 Tax=Sphingomonas longa TaxID=2778730 RepID=A0ABS2DAG9_9SPHN|nr:MULTISPECIES: hypothetical protein [Alphaproteobacteria]MBM6577941.1 hypothetical protein [Sphingomonas sp. BT552]MBR7710982.1 hypothetical protein [Microvirga sp. SRT01]
MQRIRANGACDLPIYIRVDGNVFQLWRDPATKEIHKRIFAHLKLEKMRIIADGDDCIAVTGMSDSLLSDAGSSGEFTVVSRKPDGSELQKCRSSSRSPSR